MLRNREDLVNWFVGQFSYYGTVEKAADIICTYVREYSLMTDVAILVPASTEEDGSRSRLYDSFLQRWYPRVGNIYWWLLKYALTHAEPTAVIRTIAEQGRMNTEDDTRLMLSWAVAMCDVKDKQMRFLDDLSAETWRQLAIPFVAAASSMSGLIAKD